MKKCISLCMLIGFFGYKLYSQEASLETVEKDMFSITKVIKIDSVEIVDSKVTLTPGFHIAEILVKYDETIAEIFNSDESKYILSFNVEKDKKYILKDSKLNFLDTVAGYTRVNTLTLGIAEKKEGLCVSKSIEPRELIFYQEPNGAIHCYSNPNKINSDSLAELNIVFVDKNDINLFGTSKDGEKISFGSIDYKAKNDYFLKPGYYYINYAINNSLTNGRGSFYFKISESEKLKLLISSNDCKLTSSAEYPLVKTTLGSVNLNNVFFLPDGVHGWIVGENGMILKTIDSGNNWEYFKFEKRIQGSYNPYVDKEFTNLSQSLTSIFFIDSITGWATGSKGTVIHTADGGKNWLEQNSNETEELFSNVIFLNEKEGFITPDYRYNNTSTTWKFIMNNRLKYTIDGGLTWNTLEDPDQTHPYYYVLDNSNIWKMFDDGLFYSKDMTSTWTNSGLRYDYKTTIPKSGSTYDYTKERDYYYNIFFINQFCGWSIVNNLKHTVDGGKTWTDQSEKIFAPNTLFFIDENTGWAISMDRGAIFKTMDAGKNWNMLQKTKDFKDKLTDVFFINKEIGWAVSGNGFIYQSKDGGTNWTSSHILDCTNL